MLVPALRYYLDEELAVFHRALKNRGTQFQHDASKEFGWYRSDNPPANRHELAKKYMRSFMIHFATITDDEFDASAVFEVLRKSSCIGQRLKKIAIDILNEVRNKVAHCNFHEWDQVKFLQCFDLFEEILPHIEESERVNVRRLREHFKKYKDDGLKIGI